MIEYEYLIPFEQEEFSFGGAFRFYTDEWSFLLSKNGTSIIIDNNLAISISNQLVSESLALKLFQHGFGLVYSNDRFTKNVYKAKPTLFMIDFTTKCNCNCIYCLRHFEDIGDSISPKMLKQITKYIIEYCYHNNIHHISFQPWGGEPLIELDSIISCKKMFEDAKIHADFNIQTNGLLLTLENYEKLREFKIAIGVSLDGIDTVHDAHRLDVRGNATHSKIVNNLKTIFAKYPDAQIGSLSVNSVYSKNHISENINFLINNVGLKSIKFNLVHPSGSDGFDYSILLSEEQLKEYVNELVDAVVEQIRKGHICQEANILDKLCNLLNHSNNNICNSAGCRGGTSFISFDQKGDIYPCEMIGRPEYCIGNIFDTEHDLLDLIRIAAVHNSYYAPRKTESCVECPFFCFCRGGCKASCLAYKKEPCQIDQIECALNRSLYPHLIELILTEPKIVEQMVGNRIRMG